MPTAQDYSKDPMVCLHRHLVWQPARSKYAIGRSYYYAESTSDCGRTGNRKFLGGIHVPRCQVCFSAVGQREREQPQVGSPVSLGEDGGRRWGRKDVECSPPPTQGWEEGANIRQAHPLGLTPPVSCRYAPNTLLMDEERASQRAERLTPSHKMHVRGR